MLPFMKLTFSCTWILNLYNKPPNKGACYRYGKGSKHHYLNGPIISIV